MPIAKEIGKLAVKNLSKVYDKGVSKIKNKRVKKALQSDRANSLLNMRIAYAYDKLK